MMARNFRISRPLTRAERKAQHEYVERAYHTHNVPSRRRPGQGADVRCTRRDCKREEVE